MREVLGGKLNERSPNAVTSIVANEAGPATFQAGAPMLQIRDLQTSILTPASFSLSAGEGLAARGPPGAGTTSLPRAGAERCANGRLGTLAARDRASLA